MRRIERPALVLLGLANLAIWGGLLYAFIRRSAAAPAANLPPPAQVSAAVSSPLPLDESGAAGSTNGSPTTPTPYAATYTVAQGDTLWDISVRLQVPLSLLMAANPDVNPNRLLAGTILVIPDPGNTALVARPRATLEQVTAQVSAEGSGLRLRRGPGTSEPEIAVLQALTQLQVVGRTPDNIWLEVITASGGQGWVTAKFVDLYLALAQVPVTGLMIPATIPTPPPNQPAPDYPFISGIEAHTRTIFLRGQALGNRAGVFSKIGDSLTFSGEFLLPIGLGQYDLHDYSALEPLIRFYSAEIARDENSFSNTSLAAQIGWLAGSVLLPSKADRRYCYEAESPLVCEYRSVKPSAAVILLGTNDAPGTPPEAFEYHMRQIVETTVNMGIVPILSTIPPLDQAGIDGRVERLNSIIVTLARENSLPLVDYWAAMRTLPDDGLDQDGIHPTWPPGHVADFTPHYLQFGMTARNLLTLQALDAVWRETIH